MGFGGHGSGGGPGAVLGLGHPGQGTSGAGDTQDRGHLGQGTLDSRWRPPGPGPRKQRASIICTCVEQQGCNLKTCNTDCLHFCNPG